MQTLVVGGRFGVWCCVLLDWLLLELVLLRAVGCGGQWEFTSSWALGLFRDHITLPLISEEKIDLVKPRTFSSSWLGSPISIHNRTHYSFFPSLHRSPDHSVLPDCHLSLPSITLAVPRASVFCRYFFLSVFSVEFS